MESDFIKSIQDKKIKDSVSFSSGDDKNDKNDEIQIQIEFDEKSIKHAEFVQNNAHISTSRKYPIYVEFYGVNYSIPRYQQKIFGKQIDEEIGKSSQNLIIQNIHGFAGPGEILAIMGPSGCGKTTLLNAIGNRLGTKDIEGTIKMNGHKPTKDSKRFIAYCAQDDTFFPYLTVRETLSYTSRLRLPREMSTSAKLEQVENIIQMFNLSKCSNTRIGDIRIRGISGGERKRVSIANELLTEPSVILLDEPTSGLDSSLALDLIQTLKELAKKQRKTIIMVVHQPSSQVFELFDRLLLMADGQVAYFGDSADIVDYLANEGFVCHPNFNPADYMLELLNNPTAKQKLITAHAKSIQSDSSGKLVVEKCFKKPTNFDDSRIIGSSKHKWEATFLQQLMILTERSFKQRSKVVLSKLNFTQIIGLAAITCLIWFRMSYTEASLSDRYGMIFFTTAFWIFFASFITITAFPLDFDILSKERQSRSYRLLSYFLSKQIAELPLLVIFPILYICIVYWTVGLIPSAGSFFAYMATAILTVYTSQSFGYLAGATFMDVQSATLACTLFMLASMLLGGFYIHNLPFGLSWLKYISFILYSYSLMMQIQFDSPYAKFKCSNLGQTSDYSQCLHSSDGYIKGSAVLEHLQLNIIPWYGNVLILVGISIVVRGLAYFSLKKNSRKK
ncbi:21921_t:CDS:10 [Dentiscutata erythropus]|uniref:21921_t:CDS:1 n=1 Tax=Dentiscutata erythropus TaxID=1348616 RepID=A0A9N8V708_9GLOM|nr:21921_t:CDS:10 [Dentiscutata erythropus]